MMFDFGMLDARCEPYLWGWWVTVRATPQPFNILCGTDGRPQWGFHPPFKLAA